MDDNHSHIGQTIGPFRILKFLGSGGTGHVYAAEHIGLRRAAALKFLSPELLPNDDAVQRFVREARLTAKLNHPNIVDVFDVIHGKHGYLIAMELVEGRSLRKVIDTEGRLESTRALGIAHRIARALAYAHEHHIVHRDIKPDNIMIGDDGHVKVLDFGLAKALDGNTKLTRTGATMGTPHYMSPEQCLSGEIDARTDIYSLGVVTFEMLTGETPFSGSSALEVLLQITASPFPPLRSVAPDASPALESLIANMIEKEIDDRYPSCDELISDIERISQDKKFLPQRCRSTSGVGTQGMGLGEELALDVGDSAFTRPRPTVENESRWPRRIATLVFIALLVGVSGFALMRWEANSRPEAIAVPFAVAPESETDASTLANLQESDTDAGSLDVSQASQEVPEVSIEKNEYGLSTRYSPFVVGTRWTYRVQGGGKYVVEIVGETRIQGQRALEVRGYPPPGIWQKWQNTKEFYVINESGFYIYENLDRNDPWTVLEFPMKVGDRWIVNNEQYNFRKAFLAEKEMELDVPAGRFWCIQINSGIFSADPDSFYYESRWWNPDVGFVKLYRTYAFSGTFITAELESLEIGR